jgi:hypothetical protein
MALSKAECDRIAAEGGSVLLGRGHPAADASGFLTDTEAEGIEYGEEISVDSFHHPANLALANKRLEGVAARVEDPEADVEYQEFLRFKNARARSGGSTSSDVGEASEPERIGLSTEPSTAASESSEPPADSGVTVAPTPPSSPGRTGRNK